METRVARSSSSRTPSTARNHRASDDTTSTDGTVLLARIGTCTSDALVAAAHAVNTTGGQVIGALLVGNTIGDTRRIFG